MLTNQSKQRSKYQPIKIQLLENDYRSPVAYHRRRRHHHHRRHIPCTRQGGEAAVVTLLPSRSGKKGRLSNLLYKFPVCALGRTSVREWRKRKERLHHGSNDPNTDTLPSPPDLSPMNHPPLQETRTLASLSNRHSNRRSNKFPEFFSRQAIAKSAVRVINLKW